MKSIKELGKETREGASKRWQNFLKKSGEYLASNKRSLYVRFPIWTVMIAAMAFMIAWLYWKARQHAPAASSAGAEGSNPWMALGAVALTLVLLALTAWIVRKIYLIWHPQKGREEGKPAPDGRGTGWSWEEFTRKNPQFKGIFLTIFLIGIGLFSINYLCHQGEFVWWRAGYDHKSFWFMQGAVLVSVVGLILSRHVTARLFLMGMLVAVFFVWKGAVSRSVISEDIVIHSYTPNVVWTTVSEGTHPPGEGWSESFPFENHRLHIRPGNAPTEYLFEFKNGTRKIVEGMADKVIKPNGNVVSYKYHSAVETTYVLQKASRPLAN